MITWIVTPVYRDVGSFEILRERLLEVLGADATDARFVVIDDTAGQDEEIERLHSYEDVTVLRPPFNLGHQRAIVYALRKILPRVGDDDAVVTLDAAGHHGDALLDHWLFAADNTAVISVDRGGLRLVDHGRHRDRDRIAARYRKTLARLLV